MTTKDWVYLGLILLAALAFYCNGFYAGVYRCKRMYDSLLEDEEPSVGPIHSVHSMGGEVNYLSSEDKVLATGDPPREAKVALSSRDLKGNFGNN
jgi:hypothetical protein